LKIFILLLHYFEGKSKYVSGLFWPMLALVIKQVDFGFIFCPQMCRQVLALHLLAVEF